ncbi:EF-P 5-aminopentanol modification-associated protein YfmF [Tannockella kyphosi]|uniref:EF-P 5-aminopentanol modification-associated protein YfmF n=1 Tax=Tannockella kyphosi TaxID=2899121 RepID=UPI002013A4DC|nr:pitrilysin family protein [Tannockella kyphosi]
MNKIIKTDAYTLHVIPTKKFKNISMSLKLCANLTKENATKRTLLSFMFTAGTNEYPSPREFSTYLEGMYGARFSSSVSSTGKAHIINLTSVVVNEKFLIEKESLTTKQVDLFKEVLFHPFIKNNQFDQKIFDMKKKELKARIRANKDDKFTYSFDKLLENMGDNHVLGISSNGYENEIDEIDNKELYQYLLSCLKNDEKYIYVVGDVDENIQTIFENNLLFDKQIQNIESAYPFESNRAEVLEIIEKQDIKQAKLNMGYTIDCSILDNKHFAFTLFNSIFGGFSQSKLFKVVREKHSLCYYVSSNYDSFNGVMIVCAGIEGDDYLKTRSLIEEQLVCMQKGEFSEEDINIAKMMIKNTLIKSNDEPGSMIASAFKRDLIGQVMDSNEYFEKILAITKDEIMEAANGIKLDTVFLLTGGNENE